MVRLFSSFTRWCCCTYKRLYNRLFLCSKSPMLSFTRFKRLINALAASDRRNVDSESSWTESDFLNPQFSEAVGVFRTSWLYWNDKTPFHSYHWLRQDSVAIKRCNQFTPAFNEVVIHGPAQYTAVSVHTGVVLWVHYQRSAEPITACISTLIKGKFISLVSSPWYPRRYDGMRISMDKGALFPSVVKKRMYNWHDYALFRLYETFAL